jgi:hypothetical protein
MKVTLKASTGVEILVWHEGSIFHARLTEAADAQVCLAVDLFEVIAELAALDLEQSDQAAEAIGLADDAQSRLRAAADEPGTHGDDPPASVPERLN